MFFMCFLCNDLFQKCLLLFDGLGSLKSRLNRSPTFKNEAPVWARAQFQDFAQIHFLLIFYAKMSIFGSPKSVKNEHGGASVSLLIPHWPQWLAKGAQEAPKAAQSDNLDPKMTPGSSKRA